MVKRLICIIGAGLGGVALSQAPEYTQQYTQRLAGAVDELNAIIVQFDTDAAAFGLSRQEGLVRYRASPDGFLAERGLAIEEIFDRHARLSTQLAELRQADAGTRLVSLAQYFDTDVGAAALDDFRPAVPVTPEGLGHALAGAALGFATIWAGITALMLPFRRRPSKVRISRS